MEIVFLVFLFFVQLQRNAKIAGMKYKFCNVRKLVRNVNNVNELYTDFQHAYINVTNCMTKYNFTV